MSAPPVGFLHVGEELDNKERYLFEESGKYIATFTENIRKEIHQTLQKINKISGPASMRMMMMGQLQSVLISLSTDLFRQEFEAKLDMVEKEAETRIVNTMREEFEKAIELKLREIFTSED